MWLYFNNQGQLIKKLEHGEHARVGTTAFSIFAVFEDVDSINDKVRATVKFRKPDLKQTEYFPLLMDSDVREFELNLGSGETVANVEPFEPNHTYKGFLFDFSSFASAQELVILLDTPGLWEATITVIGKNNQINVQGLATFEVAGSNTFQEETELPVEIPLNQIISAYMSKADDSEVVIAIDDLDSDIDSYEVGQYFFNKADQEIYIKNTSEVLEFAGLKIINKNIVDFTDILSLSETEISKFEKDYDILLNGVTILRKSQIIGNMICFDSALVDVNDEMVKIRAKVDTENSVMSFLVMKVETDIVGNQATTTIVIDLLTNLNGRQLTSFSDNYYDGWCQITENGQPLTEERAKDYMEFMTGSRFLPVYNYQKPQNSLFFQVTFGVFWKPQYNATHFVSTQIGMILYKLPLNGLEFTSSNYVKIPFFADAETVGQDTYNWLAVGGNFGPSSSDCTLGTPPYWWLKSYIGEMHTEAIIGSSYSNLTIKGRLSDTYSLLTPNTTGWTADRTIATTQDIFDAISNVYQLKGSATVSQLNTLTSTTSDKSTLNGFVYNVTDDGNLNYYAGTTSVVAGDNVVFVYNNGNWGWDKLATTVDLSGYVTLADDQTITGVKTFSNGIKFDESAQDPDIIYVPSLQRLNVKTLSIGTTTYSSATISPYPGNTYDLGTSSYAWKDLYLGGIAYLSSVKYTGELLIGLNGGGNRYSLGESGLVNYTNKDLGNSAYKWKDLYLSGVAYLGSGTQLTQSSDGNLQLTLSGDDKTLKPSWDGHYNLGASGYQWKNAYFSGQVYAQNTFNIINASDIVSNTLTQAQYDLITNGKPTLISGTYRGWENPLLMPAKILGDDSCVGVVFANTSTNGNMASYRIYTTKELSINAGNALLYNISAINGKTIPTYPTTNTEKQYLSIGANGGNLEWSTLSIPNVVQDLTSITTATINSTDWASLKGNHYLTVSSPTMTGLDATYEFVNIKLSINGTNQFVKLSKNTTNKYSGMFFIEESTNLYELTVYYNGTDLIIRCATVY